MVRRLAAARLLLRRRAIRRARRSNPTGAKYPSGTNARRPALWAGLLAFACLVFESWSLLLEWLYEVAYLSSTIFLVWVEVPATRRQK